LELIYPVVFLFLTVFILLALFLFFNGDSRKLNIVRERAHHLKKLGYPHHHVRYYLLKEGHHPKHVDKVLGKDVKK